MSTENTLITTRFETDDGQFIVETNKLNGQSLSDEVIHFKTACSRITIETRRDYIVINNSGCSLYPNYTITVSDSRVINLKNLEEASSIAEFLSLKMTNNVIGT